MRLFDFERAPNPRRVRIYLAEKGVEIPKVTVNLFRMEQLSPEYLALNPGGTVPLLETDDGEYIAESVGICRYLESIYPDPPLFGTSDKAQALTLTWNNICEQEGFTSIAEILRNLSPGFRHRAFPGPVNIEQNQSLIERGQIRAVQFYNRIEQRLGAAEFLAGPEFTIADITLLTLVDFSGWVEINPTQERPALKAWYQKVSGRPSARA